MEQEIIDGNKAIAEFMGAKWKDISLVNYPKDNKQWEIKFPDGQKFNDYGEIGYIISEYVKYHSSWDWLMPVVEKIESLHFVFVISTSFLSIEWPGTIGEIEGLNADPGIYLDFNSPMTTHPKPDAKSKIDAVWKAVVQFINWYNTNKQQG